MFLEGFYIGLSLILAIGPQNAFVIRQGLSGRLVFLTAFIVSLCDSVLISIGVLGIGQFLTQIKWLKIGLTIGGIVFLAVYGTKALIRTFSNTELKIAKDHVSISYKEVFIKGLSFSWLNPHAILDTLIVIGSIAAQYNFNNALVFGGGAIVASFTWFFVLAFVAKGLARYLQRPITWKIIDAFIGIVCIKISYQLLMELV